MDYKQELENARLAMEQAKASAIIEHDCWALAFKARRTVIKSMRTSGFTTPSGALNEFDKLMSDHQERYSKALKNLLAAEKKFADLVFGLNKTYGFTGKI